MPKILAPTPTLSKGIRSMTIERKEIIRTMKNSKREKESSTVQKLFWWKINGIPFPWSTALSSCCTTFSHFPMYVALSIYVRCIAQGKRKNRHKHIMQAGNRCLLTAWSQSYSILRHVCVWVISYLAGVEWTQSQGSAFLMFRSLKKVKSWYNPY